MSRPELHRVPSLDEIANDPALANDLSPELADVLQTRALQCVVALWSRQLAVRTRPAMDAAQLGPDSLLDVHEAAKRLSTSEDWLYRHRDNLEFTVRNGRQLRFSSQGIDRYIRQRKGLKR